MKIIPKLNLNKHPISVDNGSLIDANNIRLSNDNTVLCIDNSIKNIGNYDVKYAIPCNKEIVYFVLENNVLQLYRYKEDIEEYIKIDNCYIDYHENAEYVGTFTYNNNHLIIAIGESYKDNDNNIINIPLKVIDLDNSDTFNNKLYSIVPEIYIPTIEYDYINGNAYKGWYFIFIRYKISENNYTQWYNTNCNIYVNSFNNDNFINYFASKEVPKIDDNITIKMSNFVSDDKDVCSNSFKIKFTNNDNTYNNYQLGFICINKTYTKCFISNDLKLNINTNNEFIFKSNVVNEYSANLLIETYNNYYNVKTLINSNNRLYIANYKETNSIANDVINGNNFLNINVIKTPYSNKYINEYKYESFDLQNITFNCETINNVSCCNIKQLPFTKYNVIFDYNDISKENIIIGNDYINTNGTVELRYYNGTSFASKNVDINNIYLIPNKNKLKVAIINGTDIEELPISIYGTYTYQDSGSTTPDGSPIEHTVYKHIDIITNNGLYVTNLYNDSITVKENINYDVLSYNSEVFNSVGIRDNEYYNFYVHFIDKYGIITNGINIGKYLLNVDNIIERKGNNIGDTLFKIIVNNKNESLNNIYKLKIDFNDNDSINVISKLNKYYKGFFISYEKPEFNTKLHGIFINENGSYKFYSDELNFNDSIDFNFTHVNFWTINNFESNFNNVTCILSNTTGKLAKIDYKEIKVADSYNNTNKSTYIQLYFNRTSNTIPETIKTMNKNIYYYAELINNEDYSNKYNNINKTLIPCSNVIYFDNIKLNDSFEINTKDTFISTGHSMIYNNVYFDSTTKLFRSEYNPIPVNNIGVNYIYNCKTSIPIECLVYNNKPTVEYFPNTGITTTDEYDKTFVVGNIVEAKNSIDLYKHNDFVIYECHPKSLINYNKNNVTDIFCKTIRRSNVMQDESYNITWRNFNAEQYKIINENKGNVVKLISIGKYFLAHTEHSLFLFDGTDTIKSDNGNIQLNDVDIWDLNYKEVLTSELGYAGIDKESDGIVGNFGYIFYSKDNNNIFKFDNNKIDIIDTDIHNLIKYKKWNIEFGNDINRNRLLIKFNNYCVLSYNYVSNTFVSKHNIEFNKIYSTKTNIYIINNNDKYISTFDDNYCNNANISVMFNNGYESIKSIESIVYKLYRVNINYDRQDNTNDKPPVEGTIANRSTNYAGDSIRIYNDNSDTNDININYDNTKFTNEFGEYKKPYWRFGNWYFNYIRNNYTDENCQDSNQRINGNYFIIKFEISPNNNKHENVEIETVDINVNNGELL